MYYSWIEKSIADVKYWTSSIKLKVTSILFRACLIIWNDFIRTIWMDLDFSIIHNFWLKN